jgi:hypothetical protein
MTVLVFAGVTQIDEQVFDDEVEALDFADEWQDRGFTVRILEDA